MFKVYLKIGEDHGGIIVFLRIVLLKFFRIVFGIGIIEATFLKNVLLLEKLGVDSITTRL